MFFPFQKGKPIDFFMLIIEGRIEANVGKEELIFESGSFTYFGLQVLMQLIEEPFTPGTGVTSSSEAQNDHQLTPF